jgi:hypothetical protein
MTLPEIEKATLRLVALKMSKDRGRAARDGPGVVGEVDRSPEAAADEYPSA